jgi:hypothetical protein
MYDVGDVVPLGITTTDADGNVADGGTVVLTITLPDVAGSTVTPAVGHVAGSGVYTADYPVTLEGHYRVSWSVTGANASGYPDSFNVREIGDQLISLSEAKRQLGLTTADHEDALRLFIAAAGRAVENHTGRTIVRRTITETHRRVSGGLVLKKTPAVSLSSVASVDGTISWSTASLDLDGDTGIVDVLTGSRLSGTVRVTYVAGMRVIPANYLLACRIIVEHLWQTMRPFVGAGAMINDALGDSLDARSGGLVGFAIPNRALELLGSPPPLVA